MKEQPPPLPPELQPELRALPPRERAALEHAWDAAGRLTAQEPSDEELRFWGAEVWETVRRETGGETYRSGLRYVPTLSFRSFAVAAGVALLVAAGAVLWLRPVSVTAPPGEQVAVVLPDESRVELNAGATLSHPRRFGRSERVVRLKGEAYFEVRPDEVPFVVKTFNATITVLGTTFNVRAWPDEPAARTEVTLSSGRVRLTARGGGAAVVLEPGQHSLVEAGAVEPTGPAPVQVSSALSWRTHGFVLVDRPLSVVLEEVRRRFSVRVAVQDPAMLDDTISVIVNAPVDADTLLHDISQYLGYTVAKTSEGYLIRRP